MPATLPATLPALLRIARRHSRHPDDAEDLLQTVLLAALVAGRADLGRPENRHWLIGAIAKRAVHEARSAGRRRQREADAADLGWPTQSARLARPDNPAGLSPPPGGAWSAAAAFVATLPPALRTTALLALGGHDRAEIRSLLRLTDPALRQRIAALKARWRDWQAGPGAQADLGTAGIGAFPGLRGPLAFGRLRQSLRVALGQRPQGQLASHDPDGHLFVVSRAAPFSPAPASSRKPGSRQLPAPP